MPKSRNTHKVSPDLKRLKARFQKQTLELAYASRLLGMVDDALKGKGFEAVYYPEPVPHVEIMPVPEIVPEIVPQPELALEGPPNA